MKPVIALLMVLALAQPKAPASAPSVTIEVLRDVEVRGPSTLKGGGARQERGVLYAATARTIRKGERLVMTKELGEGACQVRLRSEMLDLSSCPWLEGFRDRQRDVFRVLPASASANANVNATRSPAGTYRIAVCKHMPCSPSNMVTAIAWGTLVLFDEQLPTEFVRKAESSYLMRTANGCFAMQHKRPVQSLAGIMGADITKWETRDGRLLFTLYQSPDAYHNVRVSLKGDMMYGSGRSSEDMAKQQFTSDVVVGMRVGPPDLRSCTH